MVFLLSDFFADMLFDPETGKVRDPAALKSIQFNSRGARVPRELVKDGKKITQRLNEKTGEFQRGNFNVEHSDGKIDQHIHLHKGKQRDPDATGARYIAQG